MAFSPSMHYSSIYYAFVHVKDYFPCVHLVFLWIRVCAYTLHWPTSNMDLSWIRCQFRPFLCVCFFSQSIVTHIFDAAHKSFFQVSKFYVFEQLRCCVRAYDRNFNVFYCQFCEYEWWKNKQKSKGNKHNNRNIFIFKICEMVIFYLMEI